jgi:sterol desaturase/sphingolipid hydroxylase (fatty acid hydroxylase superfamily)
MLSAANVAMVFGALLLAFGSTTSWFQWRRLQQLKARAFVPQDEFTHFRKQYRRRLTTGILIAVLGVALAGAFLTGLEPKIDRLIQPQEAGAPAAERQLTPEEKTLVRLWMLYWIVVLVLVVVVLGFAFTDALATRRFAMQQYQVIREEHEEKLRRDLAVHRAQKMTERNKRLAEHKPPRDDEAGHDG